MKIVAKRCPSCGADLDFAYGDRDVECKACRHKYAIEYEDGEIEIQSVGDRGFGLSMNEALEAMEMFSRALRGGYPHQVSRPGVTARCLRIGKPEFKHMFLDRGVTMEMLAEAFPTVEYTVDPVTNSWVFIEYYYDETENGQLCEIHDNLTKLKKEIDRRRTDDSYL